MTRAPHFKKAFTLIELLVVISIIAILIALIMPSLRQAREVAQGTLCASNIRQQGLALINYSYDNRGYVCAVPAGSAATRWMQLASPYFNNADASTFSTYDSPVGTTAYAPNLIKALQCPSTYRNTAFQEYPAFIGPVSYGINTNFLGIVSWQEENPIKLTERYLEARHSDLLLTAESVSSYQVSPGILTWNPKCDLRLALHSKKQNFGLADLHVETYAPELTREFVLGKYVEANKSAFGGYPAIIAKWPVIWGKWNYAVGF